MTYSKDSNQQPKRVLIIPAAGAGVRFRELGKNYPKCILPVQGTPIIVTSIRMLTQESSTFELVVVSCASEEHKKAIDDALAPHKFIVPVKTMIVSVPVGRSPSPAISLGQAMEAAQMHFDADSLEDVDATVFLSDMLPADIRIAKKVCDLVPDSWGVLDKPEGDFSRWCMVRQPSDWNDYMMCYDKPSEQPPTTLAACGVYRYASATSYRKALDQVMLREEPSYEIQFSDVARQYQSDRSKRIEVVEFARGSFKDFGTLEEYLNNKGINKCRSFNTITENAERGTVTKSCTNHQKIRDEICWLQNVPEPLQRFFPRIHGANLMQNYIIMDKIKSTNLRDLALYLDRSEETWKEVFKSVRKYLSATVVQSASNPPAHLQFWNKMYNKTNDRLADISVSPEEWDAAQSWVANELFESILFFKNTMEQYFRVQYMHGDLHFANMFYCFHYNELKLIDPRGDMLGSVNYDMAKLCHSIIGKYDYIDAELYRLDENGEPYYYDHGCENIEKAFRAEIFSIYSDEEQKHILRLTASLFLSMIPLHADKPEHQRLFFKEFKRIAQMAEETGKNG